MKINNLINSSKSHKLNIFKSLSILFLAFIFSQNLYSQQKDLVLVSGTVKDDLGSPIAMEMRFITVGQIPTISRSNSDGTYQQILKQGKTYLPVFKGFVEIGGFKLFEVGKFDKYQELRHDFIVRPIKEGIELGETNLFQQNDSLLSEDGKNYLDMFKEFFSINKNTKFAVTLSAPDMTFKPSTRTTQVEVKGKMKTKNIKINAKQIETEFLQARANKITEYLMQIKVPAKVFDFKFDFPKKISKPKKSKKGSETPAEIPNTTKIVIEKVLNL